MCLFAPDGRFHPMLMLLAMAGLIWKNPLAKINKPECVLLLPTLFHVLHAFSC